MSELRPCFESIGTAGKQCDEAMKAEVQDVVALQSLMSDLWNSTEDGKPLTFAVLVALHNIVTSTIPERFDVSGRHRYYCVPEALEKIQRSFIVATGALQLDGGMLRSSAALGLGEHRLKNCSDWRG